MLAIWSTYNESNHCIYHIEDIDYLQLSNTCRVGNLLVLGHCPFGLEVTLIFKGTKRCALKF